MRETTPLGYAVIDLETTGLSPAHHHRVVEIAVVHINPSGEITDRWETLVNPMRDMGDTEHIHGLRGRDVATAPRFEQVAAELLELLRGRVIVAHNADFDLRFLAAEFELAGIPLWLNPVALCTMLLAGQLLPGAGRSLADCCDACDIEIPDAHHAADDALAAAQLLQVFLASATGWDAHLAAAADVAWPTASAALDRAAWMPRPTTSEPLGRQPFLARIAERMPDMSGPDAHQNYLALLDRCLLDRELSHYEREALVALATEFGIGRTTVERLHLEYFQALTRVAWDDGVLTADELADLAAVARLLEVPVAETQKAIVGPPPASPDDGAISAPTLSEFALAPGHVVVLTGAMMRGRDEWVGILLALGVTTAAAVSKKVHVVAAADPDSLSGKARKARDYGIPIISERKLADLVAALG